MIDQTLKRIFDKFDKETGGDGYFIRVHLQGSTSFFGAYKWTAGYATLEIQFETEQSIGLGVHIDSTQIVAIEGPFLNWDI